jgi:hypothetical protein
MALFRELLELLRRPTLSPEERRVKETAERAAAAVGAPILEASDRDDLLARLNRGVESRDFAFWLETMTREAWPLIERQAPVLDGANLAPLVETLGEGCRPLLVETDRLVNGLFRVFARLGEVARVLGTELTPVQMPDDHLGFLTDPEIPPEVGDALYANMQLGASMLAILAAQIRGEKLAPWLARALVEYLAEGARRFLTFLASVPGAEVSEDLIPLDDRLDLAKIVGEARATRAAMERFGEAADRHGGDVYAPDADR